LSADARILVLADESATLSLGAALARTCPPGARSVHLTGDLGAGKTTLVRGLLRTLGHSGAVKSPTYTLVESYEPAGRRVHHFDLYRLTDPEELDYLGLDDYFDGTALCLVEWPERGEGVLKAPDLSIRLTVAGEGREARLEGRSDTGRAWIEMLENFMKTKD
jgi:tRNA threonylcarbamoyladenosine biosynthesis protein TsaE